MSSSASGAAAGSGDDGGHGGMGGAGEVIDGVLQSQVAPADDPFIAVKGWPHEVFDLLALTSAFFASVAVTPLFAFRPSDYATADALWFARYPEYGPTPVSSGVAFWFPLAISLTGLSLISAVLARISTTGEEHMTGARRKLMSALITPLAVLATVPLAFCVVTFPIGLYYCGFMLFPDTLVYRANWMWSGLWFVILSSLTISYASGMLLYFRFFNKHSELPLPREIRSPAQQSMHAAQS
jgi:hypothetical protein